jgi:hypothetical protein
MTQSSQEDKKRIFSYWGNSNTVLRRKEKRKEAKTTFPSSENVTRSVPLPNSELLLHGARSSSIINRGAEILEDDELTPGVARNMRYPAEMQLVTLVMQDGNMRSPLSVHACQDFIFPWESFEI